MIRRASIAESMRRVMREHQQAGPPARLILCTEENYAERKAMVDAGLFDAAHFPKDKPHES